MSTLVLEAPHYSTVVRQKGQFEGEKSGKSAPPRLVLMILLGPRGTLYMVFLRACTLRCLHFFPSLSSLCTASPVFITPQFTIFLSSQWWFLAGSGLSFYCLVFRAVPLPSSHLFFLSLCFQFFPTNFFSFNGFSSNNLTHGRTFGARMR